MRDSKNGPRTVWLSSVAREVLDQLPKKNSWVFPSPYRDAEHLAEITDFWQEVRTEAGVADVRPHDLRHTFASQAAMQGIPLPVVARLFGHAQVQMTLRYAHVSDRDVEAAAERIGGAMACIMNSSPVRSEATP